LKTIPIGLTRPEVVRTSVFKCDTCGLEATDLFQDPLDVQEIYKSESIYSTSPTYQAGSTYPKYSKDILRLIMEQCTPKSKILEIGCFTGNLLFELVNAGLNAEGVELDPKAAETARQRKLKVETGDIFIPVYRNNSYDMIIGIGILEHIPNPARFFQHISNLLVPGGVGILQYPNRDSLNAHLSRYSKHGWDMYTEPGHLFFFSKENIISLLIKNRLTAEAFYSATILSRGKIPFIPWRSPKIEFLLRKLNQNKIFFFVYKCMLMSLDLFKLGDTIIVVFKKN